ncbi:hypothetical protein SEA_FRANSOYER_43 [Microbacterium phage Fransoyer]|nr:hypothetical protein SEA_RUBYRALPH_43 [Microbacterium phage RubyRalph]QUE25592.1 hypothetical protein SEA_SADLAD_45 [Microbacterium phage SadLad]UUG69608.1 hypothetical protein SEA_FRANSOYER_43 [Microbacterium phage Fransoyer]
MNPWEQLLSSTSVESILSFFGLGALAILFARDLILTKAQHLRRVDDILKAHDQRVADLVTAQEQRISDLIAHHAREIAEKDRHIADVVESRNAWKEAARIERERADKVTEAFADAAGIFEDMKHVIESLNRALPPSPAGGHA